jgi:hypothetical protein
MQRIHARNLYIGTTAERTTLSASLPTDGIGATYYDTDDGNIYFWDGTIWISFGSGSGAAAFVDLTDVPASYTGASGKLVKVKADETGLEFVSPSAGSGDVTGPEGSAVGNLSTFADSTGKTLSDSGIAISDLEPARGADDNYVTAAEKTIIGNTSGTNTGDQVGDGTTITGTGTAGDPFVASASGSGSGDVVGPSSSVDNHIPVFDGITGKLLKDSGIILNNTVTNPNSFANTFWLRAEDVAGDHGATIASWNDISGNATHATQGTEANKPTLDKTTYAYTTVKFAGTQYFNQNAVLYSDWTLFLIISTPNVGSETNSNWYGQNFIYGRDVGGVNNDFALCWDKIRPTIGFGNPDVTYRGGLSTVDSNLHIITFKRHKAGGLGQLFVDGVLSCSGSSNTNNLNSGNPYIGGLGTNYSFNNYMFELLGYNTFLPLATQQALENFYVIKYGIRLLR